MTQLVPNLIVADRRKIRKVRELPIAGEIKVRVGDVVSAEDIVAVAELPGDLQILKLAKTTGLMPEEIISVISCKTGDLVSKGEVIFEKKGLFGLFKTNVSIPLDARVEFITEHNAHLGLRAKPEMLELKAYLGGMVTKITDKSVTIETEASFLQGVLGLGGEQNGNIEILNIFPGQKLTENNLPKNAQGKILVGGHSPDSGVLALVAKSGAKGLITGSIEDNVLTEFLGYDLGLAVTGNENIPFTLIITEGFGNLPMSTKHYNLLKKLNTMSASINGATQIRAGALRPEIIVSDTPIQGSSETASALLGVNSKIKIIRHPYFGMTATVKSLPSEPAMIETGAKVRVLEAEFKNGEVHLVPRANVELL